jgi:hypothetical protein
MVSRLVKATIVVAILVVVIAWLPDIRRYLTIREM